MKNGVRYLATIISLFFACNACAESLQVSINRVSNDGIGTQTGLVTFVDTPDGLDIFVDIRGLPPGEHGMHIHEYPSCAPAIQKDGSFGAALSAGGHFDPDKSEVHAGPGQNGHKGDLPHIIASDTGVARQNFLVRGLAASDIRNRSLIIHAGGDNYGDNPPLGGGGARIACGVIY